MLLDVVLVPLLGGEQRCANGWETETTFSVTVFRFRTNFKMPKLKADIFFLSLILKI